MSEKSQALLRFLKEAATIRRSRIPAYQSDDRVLWFSDIPSARDEIRSPILVAPSDDAVDYWLEVKKTSPPSRKPLPPLLVDWVRPEDLDSPDKEPELMKEITILVEREIAISDDPENDQRRSREKVPEIRRLQDNPEIEDAWLDYYVNHWEPWAEKMRRWQETYSVYETVDFMRRRLEEAEERYELFLGLGLLQWRDSTNRTVKRHLLAGSADISFDAGRGLITIVPAASFETFKDELDMLDLADRPRLKGSPIPSLLEEMEMRAWDTEKVGEILREIANRAKGDSQVDEKAMQPAGTADATFRVFYAPALILRERRPTAYEEVVERLLENSETSPHTLTAPWQRFLAEGQPSAEGDQSRQEIAKGASPGPIFFPLPTNAEQQQIIDRLQFSPGVVVKGPPGTGKSHTIANLICHLLATGEKILVTAHAPKALTVLREMLPRDMRDLCLMSLGSSREDQRQLESGVRTIIGRKNQWEQGEQQQVGKRIEELEKELQSYKEKQAEVERKLRESREAETKTHTLFGGYEGTAAQIARRLDEDRERFGWFPEPLHDKPPFPFSHSEVQLLAEMHAKLTAAYEEELQLKVGDFSLSSPEEFRRWIEALRTAEERDTQAQGSADPRISNLIQNIPRDALEKTAQALRFLDEPIARAEHALGNLVEKMLPDLFIGQRVRWERLSEDVSVLADRMASLREQLGNTEISLPPDYDAGQLAADVAQRLAYFEKGRWQGFWVIKPKIIRKTQYIADNCLVAGRPPSDLESLQKLNVYLRLEASVADFSRLWPHPEAEGRDPGHVWQLANAAMEKASTLKELLEVFENLEAASFDCIPASERVNLASSRERSLWRDTIAAALARQTLAEVTQFLDAQQQEIQDCLATGKAHPCLQQLQAALSAQDPTAWQEACQKREEIVLQQERYRRYLELMDRLKQANGPLADLLHQHQGEATWQQRLLNLEQAWCWASARGWLQDVADRQRYAELVQNYHRLKKKIETGTEQLAAKRAWQAFLTRLDDAASQNLHAWTSAVDRIGQGTGKHAYRHRRTARQYLTKCLPKIPAWIMPLHKLWDTIEACPGLFDTIIIDEASQAELTSLILLLLGKRVIVVGDKMQNSPEAVGIKEDDINRLIRTHLQDFHFRAEFRPDTSLFDHAERAFGNIISLREHFRCVPEIIRFSNDLCYREAPLVPLRQAPVDRLPPLKHTFVPGGFCEGDGQRIRNEAEAEKLVQTICACLQDGAYEGKFMGVIALQGRVQSDLIERKLAAALDPGIIAERKLRCGVPATFQGDQRDVIFLSLVAAPDSKERRFRALTELDFQRRFNVAMSRAKDQVWLFHSVQQSDLSPDCLRRRLLRFFQSPWQGAVAGLGEDLERLAREAVRRPRQRGEQPAPFDSWFEVDVALELLREGYRIHPQYEVAGYRLDLVVEGLQARLAVECNGDAWHGPERYEHDMARQRQLERAGWTFATVWESEFYIDKKRALQEILQACTDLGIYPIDMEQSIATPREDSSGEMATMPEIQSEDETLDSAANGNDVDVTGPFTGYSDESDFPDPREAPIPNICTALRKIIEKDGPLFRSSLYHLYIEGCPYLQRSGRAVRDKLDLALRTLLKAGEIEQQDELGSRKTEEQVVRMAGTPAVRLRPAGRRKLEEIPPAEVFLVLDRLQPAESEDEDLCFRKILEHFGYNQLTRTRKRHLQKLLQLFRKGKEQAYPHEVISGNFGLAQR